MAVSMKCHQCGKVKRCKLAVDRSVDPVVIVYLCSPCARELGR